MKKIAIASIIAMAATAASALDVGVTTTADYSGVSKNTGYGVTVGKQTGALSVTGGFDRFTQGSNDQDRFSVVAGYNVAKFGPVTITPNLGVAYLNNQTSADGYAMVVGIGARTPVTKNIDFTVNAARQYGQDRVRASDGNTITAGLKYKF
jgi:opacity protein-like surface antigen